eukprot:EG_transcript_10970
MGLFIFLKGRSNVHGLWVLASAGRKADPAESKETKDYSFRSIEEGWDSADDADSEEEDLDVPESIKELVRSSQQAPEKTASAPKERQQQQQQQEEENWGLHREFDDYMAATGQTDFMDNDWWFREMQQQTSTSTVDQQKVAGPSGKPLPPDEDEFDSENDESDTEMAEGNSQPQESAASDQITEEVLDELYMWVGELQYGETAASRAAAARELRALASGPARRREIAAVGAIPALATLLKEGTADGKAEAAAALAELARYNPNVKLLMDANVPPLLAALLRAEDGKDDACRMAALVALHALAADGVFRPEVVAAGTVAAALPALQARDALLRRQAVALYDLLLGQGAINAEEALAASVEPLLGMLTSAALAPSIPLDGVLEVLGLYAFRNEELKDLLLTAAPRLVP